MEQLEKDHAAALEEKETQLSVINTQFYDLEGKYKLIKKKLKREKDEKTTLMNQIMEFEKAKAEAFVTEVSETKDQLIERLKAQVEELQAKVRLHSDNEMLARQNHQQAEEHYKQMLDEKHMETQQLRDNLKRSIMDKQDFEIICQNQNNSIQKMKNNEIEMEKEIERSSNVIRNQNNELAELDQLLKNQ